MTETDVFPIGSNWYLFGKHWTLAAYGNRDGRPAYLLKADKPTTREGQRGILFTRRCLERRGVRTG